ncbi:OmpH/Skp family outer membrane protein [Sulfitobacter guttiformis]|uniref:Periplasmic chaperone for outer membrane proteins Skp n=1 Tax=Sulfitobacter guttiformis TaxID=74349 RepID=A0A420DIC1_9RHOB|nr:OmpH family outer membrane protein [Sulfitobacter guttiformis]KIN72277.1 Outer membrane chaperone Skp [Sulfitobacter guttiformis KCTC 32187]RKE93957.1 periplasmic chaperone for outer membrane proteins Skp [Sulfitobacter guttiformis]
MGRVLASLILSLVLLNAAPASAQVQAGPTRGILTFDSDRLFLDSDFGIRVAREIEAAGNELVAENRRLEAELAKAEQDLTDRRATMSPEAFRPLADAFDVRVQSSRQEQAAKSRALNALLSQEREVFLRTATPILQELMAETGATVMLERRTVFLSTNDSDITEAAITRLNERLGDGAEAAAPPAKDPVRP